MHSALGNEKAIIMNMSIHLQRISMRNMQEYCGKRCLLLNQMWVWTENWMLRKDQQTFEYNAMRCSLIFSEMHVTCWCINHDVMLCLSRKDGVFWWCGGVWKKEAWSKNSKHCYINKSISVIIAPNFFGNGEVYESKKEKCKPWELIYMLDLPHHGSNEGCPIDPQPEVLDGSRPNFRYSCMYVREFVR